MPSIITSRPRVWCVMGGVFAVSLLAGPPPAGAGLQTWTGAAPRARSIEAIVRDPLTPTRMWAASFGAGVYRSLDGGATWTAYRTGLINTFVRALAVQPRHPDSVYCGTNDGVFLSVDGGLTWTRLLSTNVSVRGITIHPIRTGILYAATYGSGIFKSVNGGKNWSAINLGLVNTNVREVAIDPAKPETLLAATGTGGGIHRSLNGGLSWTQSADTTASKGAVEQIMFDPMDPNRVYAAMLQRGVIKSPDRGVTWFETNRGLTNFNTRAIALADTFRYVGTAGSGVFVTSLSDTAWHPASPLGTPVVDALLAQAASPRTCWAGTDGEGIFTTTDLGATWTRLDGGLLDTYTFALAVRPSNGMVYDGTGFGDQFWRSSDGGASWTRATGLVTHDSEHGVACDATLVQRVYMSAYGAGVFRSDDDGLTWTNPDAGLTLGNLFVRPLIADPGASGHLYVGAGDGVWETTNGGTQWAKVGGGLPAAFSVRSLAFVPGTPPTLYAGSDSSGMWKSADNGGHWVASSSGIPVPFIHALAVDGSAPLTVFAGTDSGLYRSIDGGGTWVPLRSGLPYGAGAEVRAIVQDPARPHIWFAGLFGSGVFQSRDHGETWQPLFGQSGLTNLLVRALAVDGVRTTICAGTDDGVFALSQYWTTVDVPPATGARLAFVARPNPVTGSAVTFAVTLARPGPLELEVFDLHGARIRTLARIARSAAGEHAFRWDTLDQHGVVARAGIYFARLRTAEGVRRLTVSLIGR